MFNVVYLINATVDYDEIGNTLEKEEKRKVYCELKSISQNEFYKSRESKLEVKYCFKMNSFDYLNERFIEYKGNRYKVVRTYTNSDMVEVYVSD